jgi:prephenate dehydrogenase
MTAYFAEAPVALVIGCGGMGTSVARALGKRHPLLIADIDGERLEETIDALTGAGSRAWRSAGEGSRCEGAGACRSRRQVDR